MKTAELLGAHVKDLLARPPFSLWQVSRSTEEDLPEVEIHYEFDGHGVELICDEAERVQTIFLHRGDGEALSEIPFSLARHEVIARYGQPSWSGEAHRDPILGDYGPWDRFDGPSVCIHIQYGIGRDEIAGVTLMRPEFAPPRDRQ